MMAYLKIARFDHWIKQLFILPGAWLATMMLHADIKSYFGNIILGLIVTSFAASANYVINEWLDSEFDKFHPVKKNRPAVTEGLRAWIVYTEYLAFLLLALVISWNINLFVFIAISFLLVMGVLYNVKPVRIKDVPYLDVLSESVNNAIRFAIGWFCISVDYYPPLSFVMGYWMVGAFLMSAKRFAEYRMIGNPEIAVLYRKSFAGYSEIRLLLSTIFYGFLAVFFCGVFLIKYRIELLLILPFICGLFCYYLSLCFNLDSVAQKPEKLFKEKKLMFFVALVLALCFILFYIRIPVLDAFLKIDLVKIR